MPNAQAGGGKLKVNSDFSCRLFFKKSAFQLCFIQSFNISLQSSIEAGFSTLQMNTDELKNYRT